MNLIKLNAIDSTNTYLKQLAKKTCVPDRTVVHANHQYSGRGQMGNGWLSREGQSLTFSVLKQFTMLEAERQFVISMCVSLGILNALKMLKIPNITIKWPNDILAGNKKIAGILIENVLDGRFVKYSIIGIGLNVNEMDFPTLPQASSLKLKTGKTFNIDAVLERISKEIFDNLQNLSKMPFSEIKIKYEKALFRKGTISVFQDGTGSRFNGIIQGVSEMGALLMETEGSKQQHFLLKEITFVY